MFFHKRWAKKPGRTWQDAGTAVSNPADDVLFDNRIWAFITCHQQQKFVALTYTRMYGYFKFFIYTYVQYIRSENHHVRAALWKQLTLNFDSLNQCLLHIHKVMRHALQPKENLIVARRHKEYNFGSNSDPHANLLPHRMTTSTIKNLQQRPVCRK